MANETLDSEKTNGTQHGVSTTAFVTGLGFVVVIGLLAAAYTVISDRLNGLDSWRTTEFRSQRNDAKATCEKNHETLQVLQEWIRQQTNAKPPPTAMTIKACPNFESVDNKEH